MTSAQTLRKPPLVKRDFKKRMPPNGQFYQDYQDGISQFPGETFVSIYIGKAKPWELANIAIELGSQPPIVIDVYINPTAFYWPVKNLNVVVREINPIPSGLQDELAAALSMAGAIDVQFWPISFDRSPPITSPEWQPKWPGVYYG